MLFYCVPRQDTNPLAHRLLEHFGSVSRVLDAGPEELEKIEGVGENISTFLSLIPAVGRYYQISRAACGVIMHDLNKCGEFLYPYLADRKNEMVYLLCLDAKRKVICCEKVGEGSVNSANVPVRRVVEVALAANATTVVLAHNHPGGLAFPSGEDISTTMYVAKALGAMDIELADHIVVSDSDFVSMVQSGYYRPGVDNRIG